MTDKRRSSRQTVSNSPNTSMHRRKYVPMLLSNKYTSHWKISWREWIGWNYRISGRIPSRIRKDLVSRWVSLMSIMEFLPLVSYHNCLTILRQIGLFPLVWFAKLLNLRMNLKSRRCHSLVAQPRNRRVTFIISAENLVSLYLNEMTLANTSKWYPSLGLHDKFRKF